MTKALHALSQGALRRQQSLVDDSMRDMGKVSLDLSEVSTLIPAIRPPANRMRRTTGC